MNARDLMIGDLVKHRGKIKKIVYINDRIDHTEHHNNEIAFTSDEDEWINAGWAEPIPITAEILEKNGFEYDEVDGWEFVGKDYEPLISCVLEECYVMIDSRGLEAELRIQYVHEIQHAFRLCGLNELADNFKI